MDISNTCTITVKNSGETFKGQLDNISANGFALLVKDPFFASAKGRDISIAIDNFALTAHSVLEGRIIRSRKRLSEMQQQLGAGFMQISKSTLVNLSYMSNVEAGFSGTLLLKLKNGCKDYVSRKYLPEFKKYLGL